MVTQKEIYYTLDLEHDYAGVAPEETYETFSNAGLLERFASVVRLHDLKLTVFATGKVLERQGHIVEFFRELGSEIELHGYDHVMYGPDFGREIQHGAAAYRRYFGGNPRGYRSPGGVTSPEMLDILAGEGIQYDSSLIPSFRWGTYSNLRKPQQPFVLGKSNLVELPISVIPGVRLPIAASYIRLLGLPLYKLLFSLFGRPTQVVYLFHLVDLIPTAMRDRLSTPLRVAYGKGEATAMDSFAETARYFDSAGYVPRHMSTLHERYMKSMDPMLNSAGHP